VIKIERIYNKPRGPRGLSKDEVEVDLWLKAIRPSNSLRKRFSHDEKNGMNLKLDISTS
jgi:uncharacterized protein YeaO (DUF488 family)